MAIISAVTCLFLLISLDACIASSSDEVMDPNPCENKNEKKCVSIQAPNYIGVHTIEDVDSKAPLMTGKLQRVSGKSWGFIEHGYTPVLSFLNDSQPLPEVNNTWRVQCPIQHETFIIVMSAHLAGEDYLQIKKKKITGTVYGEFTTFHFSKKSVLISLVTEDTNVFKQQSSFLMAYACVPILPIRPNPDDAQTDIARDFFYSKLISQYMHCRPPALVEFLDYLVEKPSAVGVRTYPDTKEFGNMLDLRNCGCIRKPSPPECLNSAWVGEVLMEGST